MAEYEWLITRPGLGNGVLACKPKGQAIIVNEKEEALKVIGERIESIKKELVDAGKIQFQIMEYGKS